MDRQRSRSPVRALASGSSSNPCANCTRLEQEIRDVRSRNKGLQRSLVLELTRPNRDAVPVRDPRINVLEDELARLQSIMELKERLCDEHVAELRKVRAQYAELKSKHDTLVIEAINERKDAAIRNKNEVIEVLGQWEEDRKAKDARIKELLHQQAGLGPGV